MKEMEKNFNYQVIVDEGRNGEVILYCPDLHIYVTGETTKDVFTEYYKRKNDLVEEYAEAGILENIPGRTDTISVQLGKKRNKIYKFLFVGVTILLIYGGLRPFFIGSEILSINKGVQYLRNKSDLLVADKLTRKDFSGNLRKIICNVKILASEDFGIELDFGISCEKSGDVEKH